MKTYYINEEHSYSSDKYNFSVDESITLVICNSIIFAFWFEFHWSVFLPVFQRSKVKLISVTDMLHSYDMMTSVVNAGLNGVLVETLIPLSFQSSEVIKRQVSLSLASCQGNTPVPMGSLKKGQ